jgi:hypothetical protein
MQRIALAARLRRAARAMRFPLLLLVAAMLAVSAPAAAKRKHKTPPTFAGLKSATTCIGGPVVRPSSYTLRWDPATHPRSPPQKIIYEVFQAAKSGGEDFSTPTYTTPAGATSFATPLLSAPVYFVVRARDKAGNEDSNTIEREGQNLCE